MSFDLMLLGCWCGVVVSLRCDVVAVLFVLCLLFREGPALLYVSDV